MPLPPEVAYSEVAPGGRFWAPLDTCASLRRALGLARGSSRWTSSARARPGMGSRCAPTFSPRSLRPERAAASFGASLAHFPRRGSACLLLSTGTNTSPRRGARRMPSSTLMAGSSRQGGAIPTTVFCRKTNLSAYYAGTASWYSARGSRARASW